MDVTRRLNLIVRDPGSLSDEDLTVYESQLGKLADALYERLAKGEDKEFNVLSDFTQLDGPQDCGAGVNAVALGPDGHVYACPAFYHNGGSPHLDSLNDLEATLRLDLCARQKTPFCVTCGAIQCRRCLFDNARHTLSLNVPSRGQCLLSHSDLRVAKRLAERLTSAGMVPALPQPAEGEPRDPFEKLPLVKATLSC